MAKMKTAETPTAATLPRWLRLSLTATNYTAFFCLGLLLSLLGPTLLDLATRLDATIAHMALAFTARSLGYLLGSIVGGLIFDRTAYSATMLATTLLLAATGSFCVPLAKNVPVLAAVVSLQGLAMGFLDTGGNVLLIRCWKANCGPYLQGLHFCFGVGAFIAPLLAKQFIAQTSTIEGINCTATATSPPSTLATTPVTPLATTTTMTVAAGDGESGTVPPGFESHVATAYRIGASLLLPPALAFLALARFTPRDIMAGGHGGHGGDGAADATPKPRSRVYVVGLLSAAFLFFMLYVGTEVSYGGYIYSYTVKSCELQFSEHDGALVTSVYWGLFAVGRFFAIPLSTRFSPRTLVIVDLVGCMLASVAMACFPHNATVIWIGSGVFGFSMASIFPSGYHMVETYMDISNAATSILVVGAALGEMLIPLAVGTLFDRVGPETFLVIIVIVLSIATGVFLFMMAWVHHFNKHLTSSSSSARVTYNIVGADSMLMHELGGSAAFAITDSSDDDLDEDFALPPLDGAHMHAMVDDDDDDDDDDDEMVYDFAAGEMKRRLL
ncbi:sodium-dependent glucose transporter 1 [Salpingoeca rosetta]|uniref:Sodium-dependent glucose transporter 1 n=1 Tax=Salpingoeca rosetta (strain ATCC 50818 / BSB-021) TaxID=946362 RepID=F2UND1_SALR5|nr:sodium-dependent glucose transporter 1 [Salpingoeca rosetta]EGD79136.1 sodium-dependent glucose transporter 1 [Salpingoeca rosetta]|eukprot:XP_004989221.1 sodium-dependent glucose transporter 1 [Salpingoeca rosetta]